MPCWPAEISWPNCPEQFLSCSKHGSRLNLGTPLQMYLNRCIFRDDHMELRAVWAVPYVQTPWQALPASQRLWQS